MARAYIDEINTKKITKYNFKNTIEIDNLEIYLDLEKKTVLVIGQVEDDMSIKLGTNKDITNIDLLELAYKENQNCNIIFKPHPDILHNKRKNTTSIDEYSKFALVVTDNFALFDLINISDHVYTITSLSGFEALLQGKKVTCLGSPFYSHWGLTDDRSKTIERRNNCNLTIEQIFYASYIEYPMYLLGDLSKTINAIDQFENVEEYLYQEKLHIVNTDFIPIDIENSDYKNQKIAILTSSKEIIEIYNPLKSVFVNSDFFTFTHAEASAIIESKLVNSKDFKWLSRFYATPLSDMEKDAVSLARSISKIYSRLLDDLFNDIFQSEVKEKLMSVFALSLEDTIYDKCAIIKSLESLNNDYDMIIIHIDKYEKIKSFKSLALSKLDKNKLCFVSNKKDSLHNFHNNTSKSTDTSLYRIDKKIFKTNWFKTLSFTNTKFEEGNRKKILLCGNLTNRNYGYYPSSVEIIEILDNLRVENFFLPSHKLNEQSAMENMWLLRETKYKTKLVNIVNTKEQTFTTRTKAIKTALQHNLYIIITKRFSPDIADFIHEKLFVVLNNFWMQLIFFSNMLDETQKYNLLITTMERTIYSRLATIAAQVNGVYTIGIQPVLLSTSPRYKKAIVDFMYVVDDMQKSNYTNLGYPENKITCVGSANLRKNITLIENEPAIENFNNAQTGILFIMQHSMPTTMINILEKLVKICENDGLILYIKPHPHQEKSTIGEISILQEKYSNAILLDSKANTYTYVKNCDIIVGIYSNVLFEAILADKDVLILKSEVIHDSIDFSKLNISILSEISDDIYEKILDFTKNTPEVVNMRKRREKFILEHNYYYSNKTLIENLRNILENSSDLTRI